MQIQLKATNLRLVKIEYMDVEIRFRARELHVVTRKWQACPGLKPHLCTNAIAYFW